MPTLCFSVCVSSQSHHNQRGLCLTDAAFVGPGFLLNVIYSSLQLLVALPLSHVRLSHHASFSNVVSASPPGPCVANIGFLLESGCETQGAEV